jgi:hypothetical protein
MNGSGPEHLNEARQRIGLLTANSTASEICSRQQHADRRTCQLLCLSFSGTNSSVSQSYRSC